MVCETAELDIKEFVDRFVVPAMDSLFDAMEEKGTKEGWIYPWEYEENANALDA